METRIAPIYLANDRTVFRDVGYSKSLEDSDLYIEQIQLSLLISGDIEILMVAK